MAEFKPSENISFWDIDSKLQSYIVARDRCEKFTESWRYYDGAVDALNWVIGSHFLVD
jgi:hypothetical protein